MLHDICASLDIIVNTLYSNIYNNDPKFITDIVLQLHEQINLLERSVSPDDNKCTMCNGPIRWDYINKMWVHTLKVYRHPATSKFDI